MPLLRLQVHLQRRTGRGLIFWIRRTALAALAAVGLYLVAAGIGGLWPNTAAPQDTDPKTQRIVLLNGPIHYDLLLPIDVARRNMGWLKAQGIALDHPDVAWVVIGWGARDFYTTTGGYADVSARAVWRGVSGDSAVMRVSVTGQLSQDWRSIALTDAQMAQLTRAITDTFAQAEQTAALDHPGFSEFDQFFPAKGRFHLFQTCNAWVGDMMQAAGVRFGAWTPTPFAVSLAHYRFGQQKTR